MRPRNLEEEGRQGEMFQARLDQILNLRHALVESAQSIDWAVFERELGMLYVEKVGCPGLPIRLLVGLHYLKYVYDVSDEGVVARRGGWRIRTGNTVVGTRICNTTFRVIRRAW